jgi:glyoxylase I family protein
VVQRRRRALRVERVSVPLQRIASPFRGDRAQSQLLGREAPGGAIGLIQLRAGRSLVDLVPDAGGAPPEHPNVDHLCLATATSDLDEVVRYLAPAGVETIVEPMVRYGARGYVPSIYCRDPEGNVVELKGPSRDAAVLLGRPATHDASISGIGRCTRLGNLARPRDFKLLAHLA